MGASASVSLSGILQQKVSKNELPPEIAGLLDFQGQKTVEEVIRDMEQKIDVCIAHCFEDTEKGAKGATHKLASKINAALKKKKIRSYFDENKEADNKKMESGVSNCRVVLVLLTKEYVDKVKQTKNVNDSCKFAFNLAASKRTSTNMLPVVIEKEVKDPKSWEAEVGSVLSKETAFDFSSSTDANFDSLFEGLYSQIIGKLKGAPIELELEKVNWNEKVKALIPSTAERTAPRTTGNQALDVEIRYLSETEKYLAEQLVIAEKIAARIPSREEIEAHYEKVSEMLQKHKLAAVEQMKLDEQCAAEKKKAIRGKMDEVLGYQAKAEKCDMKTLREYTASTDVKSKQFKEQFSFDLRAVKTNGFTFNDVMPRLNEEFFLRFGGGNKGSAQGVFDRPHGLCLSTSEPLLFVTDVGNNRIQVSNSFSGDFVRIIGSKGSGQGQLNAPEGICIGSDNLLYVVDSGNHRIQVFNTNGDFVRSIGAGKGVDEGKLYDPKGVCYACLDGVPLLFVADSNNNRVQLYHATTGDYVRTIGTGSKGSGQGQLDTPSGCCIGTNSAGEPVVYVSEVGNHRVQVFNAITGDPIRMFGMGTPGNQVGQLNQPRSVCLGSGPSGETLVFVSEYSNHRVQVFNDKSGEYVQMFGTGSLGSAVGQINYPFGVAVGLSSSGEPLLYASAYHKVQVFNVFSGQAVMYKK